MDQNSLFKARAEEFNAIIFNSMHCFYCFSYHDLRKLALIEHKMKHESKSYDFVGVPLCLGCHGLGVGNLDKEFLLNNMFFAISTLPDIEVLSG
jgi:hypothetical protein